MNREEQYLDSMRTRIRWASDMTTNAYIKVSAPDFVLVDVLRLISDAESTLQVAKQFAMLYADDVDAR